MRIPTVASFSNVRATPKALKYIDMVNLAKRYGMSYKEIAKSLKLSERTVRRYYWGIHSLNDWGVSREQIRIGACVPLR
jgi:DNA invertase Pin-like site-specific DNA recombinase